MRKPPDGIAIRLARPEEAGRIAPLVRELILLHGEEPPREPDALLKAVQMVLLSPAAEFLVAQEGQRLVGALQVNYRVSTWKAAPHAYVEDFYVVPDCRGRGIGSALLTAALERCKERGCARVSLDVRRDFEAAARFYLGQGFREAHAQLMVLDLSCHP